MFERRTCVVFAAIFCTVAASLLHAENSLLSEVHSSPTNSAGENCRRLGRRKVFRLREELTGDKKMLLLPGKPQVSMRQPWYKDYVEKAVLEPGEVHTGELFRFPRTRGRPERRNGELKLPPPPRAAVFVDQQFFGTCGGVRRPWGGAMLLTPGQHYVRIALQATAVRKPPGQPAPVPEAPRLRLSS